MTQIRSVKYKINTPNNFRVCDQRKAPVICFKICQKFWKMKSQIPTYLVFYSISWMYLCNETRNIERKAPTDTKEKFQNKQ